MKTIFSIVAILSIAMTIQLAYSEEVTIDVPFKEYDFKGCIAAFFEDSDQVIYNCTWLSLKDEIIRPLEDSSTGEIITPEIVEEEAEPERELIAVEKPKPKTIFEIETVKLQKHLDEDGYLPSHKAQLLTALLSLQEECEIGTLQGAAIQNYELFTIASFEPYTHTNLGTQYILKLIETAIQICDAQQIMNNKVLGEQYLHIPGKDDVKQIWTTNATLPEDVQAKYDEAKMFDYFLQKTTNDAEHFKCTKDGRARGLGYDCKAEEDQVIPETIISEAGNEVLFKYQAYLETGIADIPQREADAPLDQLSLTRQYLESLGWSPEKINAAIAVLEAENDD